MITRTPFGLASGLIKTICLAGVGLWAFDGLFGAAPTGSVTISGTPQVGQTLTVSNDAGLNMSVVDLDEMFIPVIEELIGVGILSGGSFFAGCCSLCGGLVALVVGLLRFGGGNKQPNVQFQMN